MIYVGDPGTYRIEGFEWTNQGARRKYFNFDAAAGDAADRFRETNGAVLEAWRSVWPVGYHLQLPQPLCDRRRREAGSGGSAERSCAGQNIAPPHGPIAPITQARGR